MPIRGSKVEHDALFKADLDKLVDAYPHLPGEVAELEEFLTAGYHTDPIPVDSSAYPNTYAVRLDYRRSGADGKGAFRVIYHATPPDPSMRAAFQIITLLALERV